MLLISAVDPLVRMLLVALRPVLVLIGRLVLVLAILILLAYALTGCPAPGRTADRSNGMASAAPIDIGMTFHS